MDNHDIMDKLDNISGSNLSPKTKKFLWIGVFLLALLSLWIFFPLIFINDGSILVYLLFIILLLFLAYKVKPSRITQESYVTIGAIGLTALFFFLQNVQSTQNNIDAINTINQYNCLAAQNIVINPNFIESAKIVYDNNGPFLTAIYENNMAFLRQRLGSSSTLDMLKILPEMYAANTAVTMNLQINSQGTLIGVNAQKAVDVLAGNNVGIVRNASSVISGLTQINKLLGGATDFCSSSTAVSMFN